MGTSPLTGRSYMLVISNPSLKFCMKKIFVAQRRLRLAARVFFPSREKQRGFEITIRAAYGREALKDTFYSEEKVISIPYQLFIDGFGLYRNIYRSLVGFYMIPAAKFPKILGPHTMAVPSFAHLKMAYS